MVDVRVVVDMAHLPYIEAVTHSVRFCEEDKFDDRWDGTEACIQYARNQILPYLRAREAANTSATE